MALCWDTRKRIGSFVRKNIHAWHNNCWIWVKPRWLPSLIVTHIDNISECTAKHAPINYKNQRLFFHYSKRWILNYSICCSALLVGRQYWRLGCSQQKDRLSSSRVLCGSLTLPLLQLLPTIVGQAIRGEAFCVRHASPVNDYRWGPS